MSNESAALIADLKARVDRAVEAARAEGHAAAMAEIRALVGGEAAPVKRGPGRPPKSASVAAAEAPRKARRLRRNPWAGLSPAEKLARVNAIRKGRGLPLKSSL